MSQLKYRINSVSSQHPRYPASNLLLNQQGWQSSVSCEYPQSLTIQFCVPIKTKKLHLLFHQYKIPKLIEVFVKLGGKSNYRKLGHVIPNDNSQSQFEQKQQKTLYFEFSCTHIRFVIHQNYKNGMNVLSQIAIEDLIVIGDVLPHKEIAGIQLEEEDTSDDDEVSQSVQIGHSERTLEREARSGERNRNLSANTAGTSPLFRDIYRKLQTQKEEAVSRQDYSRASSLKSVLINFHNLQKQIGRLQNQKAQALKNEDYDRCQRIKVEINKKKEMVELQKEDLFRNQQQFYAHNFYSRVIDNPVSPIPETKRKQITPNINNYSPKDLNKFKSPQPDSRSLPIVNPITNNSSIPHDQKILPALLNKNKSNAQDAQHLPLDTNQKKRIQFIEVDQSVAEPENNYSSVRKQQVRLMTERDGDGLMGNQSIREELLPLENKLRIRLQNYFDFLPEKTWKLCQHKNWKGKLQALQILRDKIEQIQNKEHFLGALEMVSRIIVSKHTKLSLASLQILNRLTELNIHFTLNHNPFFVQDIIIELLNFLSDNTHNKIKQLAYMTYFNLPRISFLSLSVVIRQLIKHKSGVKNDPKLVTTKLQLMSMIVENYKQAQYNFKEIMNWVTPYLEDPQQKVKSTAGELLIALAYLVGAEKILKAIQDMKRPQLLQVVFHLMNNSVDHSKANIDVSKVNIGQNSKLSLDNNNSRLQQQFYGADIGSNRSNRHQKAPKIEPIYGLKSQQRDKLEQSKNSRKESDHVDFQLSESHLSGYEQSLQHGNFNNLQRGDGQIRVLEGYEEQQEEDDICQYCGQQFETDEKSHYIRDCRLLAHCQSCNSLIYVREFTEHLLKECENYHLFRGCRKCGLAVELGEINEHMAKDTCQKKLGLNWERCQFCAKNVFGQDEEWIKHALQCGSLPDRRTVNNYSEMQQQ